MKITSDPPVKINLPLIKDLLNCMDQGAILTDENYHIVCFNTTADNMVRKVLGKHLSPGGSVFSYYDQHLKDQLKTAKGPVRTGRSMVWQRSFLTETPVVYQFSIEPFSSVTGFSGLLIKLMDITDHVRMEEALKKSNERYRLATLASYDMIWERDFSSGHYFFSEALMDNYGYDNLEKWTWAQVMNKLVHPEDREMVINFVTGCYREKKELFRCPIHRYIRKDGTIVWVDVRCIAIYDAAGHNVRTVGVTRDISREHILEQELLHQTQLLKTTNQELERFTHLASHDLREPLRMVSSFLQLLAKKYNNSLDDDARKYISFALDGAERMQVRVQGLLKLARAGAAGNKEQLSMTAVVRDVLQDLSLSIAEKNATISILSPLPEIYSDKDQMQLVLLNLVGNALKYTGGQPPRIDIACEDAKDHWQFSVRDNGIGIEPRNFQRVFELFQRLHSQDEYEGSGIGLVIVKKIVEQGGGKVWVESSPPNGSCFYFTVPK
jgi:PAS domain S-box-containing protein